MGGTLLQIKTNLQSYPTKKEGEITMCETSALLHSS